MKRDYRTFGSYHSYIKNIQAVIDSARCNKNGTLFYMVGDDSSAPSPYLLKFKPPEDTIFLFWYSGYSCVSSWRDVGIAPTQFDEDGFPDPDPGPFEWADLKKQGIKTILLGGERSIDKEGVQCIGEITKEMLEQGLEVRGISGCIYPLKPCTEGYELKHKELVEVLYQRAVNPSELFR